MSAFLRMLVAFVWCCSLPVQPFALHGLQTKSLVSRGAALPLAKLDYQAIPLKREGPLSALDPARRRYRILDGQRPLHTRALYWLEDARAFSEHRLRVILRSLTGAGESPVQADVGVAEAAATPVARGWRAIAQLFVDLWRALKRLFSPETPTVPIPEEAQPRNPRERPALALSRANFLPAAYFAAPANGSRPVSGSGSAPLLTLPFQLGRKPRLRSSNAWRRARPRTCRRSTGSSTAASTRSTCCARSTRFAAGGKRPRRCPPRPLRRRMRRQPLRTRRIWRRQRRQRRRRRRRRTVPRLRRRWSAAPRRSQRPTHSSPICRRRVDRRCGR